MELYQLRYFKTVADMKSLTKAAQKLFISQPALSKSIIALEKELGVQLFSRKNRNLALNEYGQMYYRRIERALNELEEAEKAVANAAGTEPNELTLPMLMPEYFPLLAYEYRRINPGVRILQAPATQQAYQDRMVGGELKFCISNIPFSHPNLEWRPLAEDKMLLMMPGKHRLAGRQRVSLSEFRDEEFISTLGGTPSNQGLIHYCKMSGFDPVIGIEAPEVSIVAEMVSGGHGCSFVSEHIYKKRMKAKIDAGVMDISVSEVLDIDCSQTIGVVLLKSALLTKNEKQFLDFTEEYFGKLNSQ